MKPYTNNRFSTGTANSIELSVPRQVLDPSRGGPSLLDLPQNPSPRKKKWYTREWYEQNRERLIRASAEWQAKNKDRVRERMKNAYALDRDKFRQRTKGWREKHKDQVIIKDRKKKARTRGLDFLPMNTYFPGAVVHHVNTYLVIFVPEELHRAVRHNMSTNEGMEIINDVAFRVLDSSMGVM